MKVNKINEEKVVCILSRDEIELYEVKKGFDFNKSYNKQLIVDILSEVDLLEKINTYNLYIEMIKSSFGSLKIIISLLTEEEMNKRHAENPELKISTGAFATDENNMIIDDVNEDGLYENNNDDYDYDDEDYEDYDDDEDNEDDEDYEEMEESNNILDEGNAKIFCFNKLDDVIDISYMIKNSDIKESSLYKNNDTGEFYLVLNSEFNKKELNIVLGKISEFCSNIPNKKYSFIKEHYKCIIQTDAINSLSKF